MPDKYRRPHNQRKKTNGTYECEKKALFLVVARAMVAGGLEVIISEIFGRLESIFSPCPQACARRRQRLPIIGILHCRALGFTVKK